MATQAESLRGQLEGQLRSLGASTTKNSPEDSPKEFAIMVSEALYLRSMLALNRDGYKFPNRQDAWFDANRGRMVNVSSDELVELKKSLMNEEEVVYASILAKLRYALENPDNIDSMLQKVMNWATNDFPFYKGKTLSKFISASERTQDFPKQGFVKRPIRL